jgi:hypothetical protein
MKQFSDKVWKAVFIVAAIWNLYFAISALVMPEYNMKVFFGEEAVSALSGNFYAATFYNLMWGLILNGGLGFCIVALNVNKNHGIVLIGIIGKLFFFGYYGVLYVLSKCTLMGMMGITGDFIFALLFAYFLVQKRQAAG